MIVRVGIVLFSHMEESSMSCDYSKPLRRAISTNKSLHDSEFTFKVGAKTVNLNSRCLGSRLNLTVFLFNELFAKYSA